MRQHIIAEAVTSKAPRTQCQQRWVQTPSNTESNLPARAPAASWNSNTIIKGAIRHRQQYGDQ